MFRRHPIAVAYVVAIAAWAGLALQARAEEVTMSSAAEAGSLHEGPLDMVATYAAERRDALAVSATFAPRLGAMMSAAPTRMEMALGDGEAVEFSIPGYPQVLYRFLRSGPAVTISARLAADAGL